MCVYRCEEFDPCASRPCPANANCIRQAASLLVSSEKAFVCECVAGFLGRNCTIRFEDTCMAEPCMNGATCHNVTRTSAEPYESLEYECACAHGFEGPRCQSRIDHCQLHEPCSNGATCSNNNNSSDDNDYTCSCAPGWKGVNCTEDVDECSQMRANFVVPCSGNGKCVNKPGAYKCMCNSYNYGEACEFTHICQNDQYEQPCRNGAFCEVLGELYENRYECKCLLGYAGDHCQYATCDLQPCKHHSTCHMLEPTRYKCNCTGTGKILFDSLTLTFETFEFDQWSYLRRVLSR